MNKPLDKQTELEQLLAALSDRTIDAHRMERLGELISTDPVARAQYIEQQRLHATLLMEGEVLFREAESLAAMTDETAVDSDSISEDDTPELEGSWWQRGGEAIYDIVSTYTALSLLVAGLVTTIFVLSMALIVPDWNSVPPAVETPSVEFVAHITDTHEATFGESSDGNFMNRDLFEDDSLVLREGLVVITYDTGARVVLEGPATYRIQGANGGNLQLGKLVAEVNTPQSQGFAVEIPGARIVDLGTEFGVKVTADGAADIAVLSGEIELYGAEQSMSMRLAAGQAASVVATSGLIARREAADQNPFAALRAPLLVGRVPAASEEGLIFAEGFELPELERGLKGQLLGMTSPGWSGPGFWGLANRDVSTEKKQHAWLNGPAFRGTTATLHYTLDEKITVGTTYVLTLDVGQTDDFTGSIGTVRLFGTDGGFEMPLAQLEKLAPPVNGFLRDQTLTFTATAEHATGQQLGIALICSGGIQVRFDNVRLAALPPQTKQYTRGENLQE